MHRCIATRRSHRPTAAQGRIRDTAGCEHGPFDLVIAADGAASRLRAAVCVRGIDRPYPWGALWCLLPGDRLVLLGDAAHAMSPQLGQGVNMALLDVVVLRDALRAQTGITAALTQYERMRRRHVAIYQFWSRWLTPLFQSELDAVARLRDVAMPPLGRLPGGSSHMLRVLSGTQHGWLGRLGLDPAFVAALSGTIARD